MELDEQNINSCRMCDAEFNVEGFNIDEEISFCPYCGSTIDPDLDEEFDDEFYDEDRTQS